MFLRNQLATRIPAFRLYFNSVPSTSSMSFLSPRQNHVIASSRSLLARHFGASLVWIKGAGEVKGARTKQTNGSNGSSNRKGRRPDSPLLDLPGSISFIFGLLCGCVAYEWRSNSASVRFYAKLKIPELRSAPEVDFSTLIDYLNAGKIKEIKFVNGIGKVVGTLNTGAFIDGKMVTTVIVNYNHSHEQFSEEVREVESEMHEDENHVDQEVSIGVFDALRELRICLTIVFVFLALSGAFLFCTNRGRSMVRKFDQMLGIK